LNEPKDISSFGLEGLILSLLAFLLASLNNTSISFLTDQQKNSHMQMQILIA
jgi:hypothetical protein